MEPLLIQATKSSPYIFFDHEHKNFEIRGHSYPENAHLFYKPVLDWLDSYLKQTTDLITFNFYLIYLNTSSSKFMLSLFDLLEQYFIGGKKININWQYDGDNEIILECGKFFKEDRNLPFNLVENVNHSLSL